MLASNIATHKSSKKSLQLPLPHIFYLHPIYIKKKKTYYVYVWSRVFTLKVSHSFWYFTDIIIDFCPKKFRSSKVKLFGHPLFFDDFYKHFQVHEYLTFIYTDSASVKKKIHSFKTQISKTQPTTTKCHVKLKRLCWQSYTIFKEIGLLRKGQ